MIGVWSFAEVHENERRGSKPARQSQALQRHSCPYDTDRQPSLSDIVYSVDDRNHVGFDDGEPQLGSLKFRPCSSVQMPM